MHLREILAMTLKISIKTNCVCLSIKDDLYTDTTRW